MDVYFARRTRKTKKVTPNLLTKMFNSEATYLYWINNSDYDQNL